MIDEEKSYGEIYIKNIGLIKEIYKNEIISESNYIQLENIINEIENYVSKTEKSEQNKIEIILKKELNNSNEKYILYILSFLVKFYKKTEYLNKMFEITLNSKVLSKETKYFIFGQLNYVVSTIENIADKESLILQTKLYEHVVEEFNKEIGSCSLIPKKQRNEEFIIVFTTQMLGIGHGPTKTALDGCYELIKHLNKKVMLINTNELFSDKGAIPIRGTVIANESKNVENINYKNITIPFYKTKNKMPDTKEYINITNMVKKYKPYLIFSIGDKCIISDICKQIVPTVTICLGDTMPLAKSDFIIPCGNLLNKSNDKRILKTKLIFDLKHEDIRDDEDLTNTEKYFVEAYGDIISNPLFK